MESFAQTSRSQLQPALPGQGLQDGEGPGQNGSSATSALQALELA